MGECRRLRVEDVFRFDNGVTCIVGTCADAGPFLVSPVCAEIHMAGALLGEVRLVSERMPAARQDLRCVETCDSFSWDASPVESGAYELRWSHPERA